MVGKDFIRTDLCQALHQTAGKKAKERIKAFAAIGRVERIIKNRYLPLVEFNRLEIIRRGRQNWKRPDLLIEFSRREKVEKRPVYSCKTIFLPARLPP